MLKQFARLGFGDSFSKLHVLKKLVRQMQGIKQLPRTLGTGRWLSTSSVKSKGRLWMTNELDCEDQSHMTEAKYGDYGNWLHVPVMVEEVTQILTEREPRTIIDMTFGAGGHSKAFLDSLPDCQILALDRDPQAHKLAQSLAEERPGKIIPLLGRFSDLADLLTELHISPNSIDGAIFDLGSSSMQFDQPERGFSLSRDGPLDMRMDGDRVPGQPTAADVVNILDEVDLAKILRKYGDETRAKIIAHGIVEARSAFGKITSTRQLADIINTVLPGSYGRDSLSRYAHSATRTFQALRIFVNNEMNELHNGLELVNMYLKPGGVCIAIAFHSLEDRIIKRHFHNIDLDLPNNISIHKRAKPRGAYSVYTEQKLADTAKPKWLPLKKKVDLPSVEEVSENPRSRSAKLRAALKT